MKNVLGFILLATLALSGAPALHGQITGALRGTVEDTSGGVVRNASVTLTSLGTRASRACATGGSGEFVFELLSVGRYQVRADAPGFAPGTAEVDVRAGETIALTLRLRVGPFEQTVQVTDAVSHLDTENAQLQTSYSGHAIQEIPVGRNATAFAITAPGVVPVSPNNPFLGSGNFNANGGRGRANNIVVDGITATDLTATGTGGVLNPLNFSAIAEVQVITNNFSAEYGRNAGSQVLYITKSGANAFHGELYEYFQNNLLNARGFFDRTGSVPELRQNVYGFEAGGPVYLPKLYNGRNRLFWHVDSEGGKRRGLGTPVIAAVPTPAQLASITDPTALALAKQYQLPSSPTGTLSEYAPNATNAWQVAERGDVVISRNDTLWARYSVYDSVAQSASYTFITSNLPYFGASSAVHPRQATLAEIHVFHGSLVNEFRFGFGQSNPSFPIRTPDPLGPQINFGDGTASLGLSYILPQGRDQRTYQYTDNLSYSRGAHTFKSGIEWYRLAVDSYLDSNVRSTLTFASFAAFAAGQLSSYTQSFGNTHRQNRENNAFAFLQDDWRISRRLTVNLGARLEYSGGPTESHGLISNLNLDQHAAFGAAGAGPLGQLETGQPSYHGNYNWAPRLGFAFRPFSDNKTVIRGGYGIAYDFIFLNPITNQRSLPPLSYTATLSGASSFTGANSFANLVGGSAAIQLATSAAVGQLSATAKNFGAINPAIQQNLRNPRVQQWSLGAEREVVPNLVVKATYVGTKGTYLLRTQPLNLSANPPAPATSYADELARLSQFTAANAGLNGSVGSYSNRLDPRFNAVNYVESNANSSYNALQVEVQKRYHERYFVNAAYTWSHSLDDNSDVLSVLINDTPAQQNPASNRNNRASSQFDVRQTLAITHTWELPFFLNSSSHLLRTLLGGWAVAGIGTVRTGFPVNIYAGSTVGGMTDPLQYLGSGNSVDRPNIGATLGNFNPQPAGSASAPAGTSVVNGVPISTWAQSLGLSQPLLGNYGTLGRNVLRLNGQTNFDCNIYKNFHITEKINLQLRGEYYNIFNAHSFLSMTSSSITSSSFGQYNAVSQPSRTAQLAARLIF